MQLEYKYKKNANERDRKSANIDMLIYEIFSSFMQMKLESLFSEMNSSFREKHLFDTISLASKITTQRSYVTLINEIK